MRSMIRTLPALQSCGSSANFAICILWSTRWISTIAFSETIFIGAALTRTEGGHWQEIVTTENSKHTNSGISYHTLAFCHRRGVNYLYQIPISDTKWFEHMFFLVLHRWHSACEWTYKSTS